MSSLAATQADGYYLPPEYFESGAYKKKSKNQFAGSKGHNQYETKGICRFELPYDGICMNKDCGQIIRRGTRFNARKTTCEEMYYSSKIYEFRMTCRRCGDCEFVIRTNPKGRCFDYISGVKIKAQGSSVGTFDMDVGDGSIDLNVRKDGNYEESDDIFIMEKQNENVRKANAELDKMKNTYDFQKTHLMDDYSSNSKLRAAFRVERKAKKQRLSNAKARGLGKGIEVSYTDNPRDTSYANDVFSTAYVTHNKVKKRERDTFMRVRQESIFHTKISSKKFDAGRVKDGLEMKEQASKLSRRTIRSACQNSRSIIKSSSNREQSAKTSLSALIDYASD